MMKSETTCLIILLNLMAPLKSAYSQLIPYYLGNTLIMIDSNDFRDLPRNREPSILTENQDVVTPIDIQNAQLNNIIYDGAIEEISLNDFDEKENELDYDAEKNVVEKGENNLRSNLSEKNAKDPILIESNDQSPVDVEETQLDSRDDQNELSDDNEGNKETMLKDDTISAVLKINDPRASDKFQSEVSIFGELKINDPRKSEEAQNEIQGNEEKQKIVGDKIAVNDNLYVREGNQDKERNFLYIPLPESLLASIQRRKSELKEEEEESENDMKVDIKLPQEKESMKYSSGKPSLNNKIPESKNEDKIEPVKIPDAGNEKLKTKIQVEELIIPGKKGRPSTTLLYLHSPGIKKNIKKNTLEDLNLEQLSEAPAAEANNIHDFLRLKSLWDRIHDAKKNES